MDAPNLDSLRTREYWENRYENEPSDHEFDWFKSYDELAPWLTEWLRPDDKILVLGCGNSVFCLNSKIIDMKQTLSSGLYRNGYRNILNVDFSETVISRMAEKYSDMTDMNWKVTLACPHGSLRCRKG